MFKQKKKTNKRIIWHDDDEEEDSNQPIRLVQPKRAKNYEEEDEVMLQLGMPAPTENQLKVKHKLKTAQLHETNEGKTEETGDFQFKRKRNKVNSDAVASVQSLREDYENDSGRYSHNNIKQLIISQNESNIKVSEHIKQTNPNEIIKNYLSDDEFDEQEQEKIKNIIKTKHRIKVSQTGMAMNAGKDEFLTPKDIWMAREEMKSLAEGIEIEDMYTLNSSKHNMVIDDSIEGESWIDNQLVYALGGDHMETDQNLLAPYVSGANTTDFMETAEMRSIKRDMEKPVNDYVNELELQIDHLQLSIKRNKDIRESIAKGIASNETEVENADRTINENVSKFKLLIDITAVVEDLCSMFDEKEAQINEIYKASKLIKSEDEILDITESKPSHRGIGFRKSKFDQPAQTKIDNNSKIQIEEI